MSFKSGKYKNLTYDQIINNGGETLNNLIGDEFKTNNIDLLIHVMNFVEMYFTGHKMGRVKEEVVRRVLLHWFLLQ